RRLQLVVRPGRGRVHVSPAVPERPPDSPVAGDSGPSADRSDVIWTQTLTIPWGALAARALHKPHVWSVCEYGDPDHHVTFAFAPAEILRPIEQWSDHVFAGSPSLLRELFPNLPAGRASHLYRHIPIAGRVASSGTSLWRHEGVTRLALLGVLQPGKGQHLAL